MSYPHQGADGSGVPSHGIHCGVGFFVQAEVMLLGFVVLSEVVIFGRSEGVTTGGEIVVGLSEVRLLYPSVSEDIAAGEEMPVEKDPIPV